MATIKNMLKGKDHKVKDEKKDEKVKGKEKKMLGKTLAEILKSKRKP